MRENAFFANCLNIQGERKPMKLAILSDFHLGYERFAEDAFNQAMKAMTLASAEADALLLPGDLFDSKIPKPETMAQAIDIFRVPVSRKWAAGVEFVSRDGRKNLCGIPVIAIHGTHESRAKTLVNPVQMLERAGLVVNAHAANVVIVNDEERVMIFGLGGVPDSQAKAALEVLDPKPTSGAFSIFMFHQSLRELLPVGEDCLSMEDLPEGFDLYVCGHVHKPKTEFVNNKRLVIPGSTVITQMRKDEEMGKGFYLFDTKTGACEFREIGSRPFFFREIELKEASPEDATNAVRKTISDILKSGAKNPVIRVRVSGTLKNGTSNSSVSFSHISEEFAALAFLSVEKSLDSKELEKKIGELRDLRQKGASTQELGIALLGKKLKEKNFLLNGEQIFEVLSAKKGGVEKIVDELLRNA